MFDRVIASSFLLFLASCAPELSRHDDPVPLRWTGDGSASEVVSAESMRGWWQRFDDPVLVRLIAQGVERSPDLGMAIARVREARGLEQSAGAGLWPSVDVDAAGAHGRNGAGSAETMWQTAGLASFDVDVFGKARDSASAAGAGAAAAAEEHAWARLNLVAEIARSYIEYRASAKQVLFAERNLASQTRTQEHVRRQAKAGVADAFDVERVELSTHQSSARTADYRRQRKLALFRLATLTTLGAEELQKALRAVKDVPGLDLGPLTMAPASVLAMRPDVRAANLRLSQQTALKDSEAASVFPAMSVTGLFGLDAPALLNPLQVWSVAGRMAWNLVDFGRIEGRIDAAAAREVEAYHVWRKTVLAAIEDVESALSTAARAKEQRLSLQRAREHAGRALALAESRYKAGESSLLDVLDSQRQVIDADSALVSAEALYVGAIVALYRSTGVY